MTSGQQGVNEAARELVSVVLGGGGAGDPLAQAAGVPAKALVAVDGLTLAERVITALRASSAGPIIYVGPLTPELEALVDYCVPAGKRFVDSMTLGFGAALAVRPGARVLVTTADLPWIDGPALDRFIAASGSAQIAYPVIPAGSALTQFPQQKRTFVKLHDGRFTGGNQMLIEPEVIPAFLDFIERLYKARKNPFALSSLLGFDILLALLTGRARIGQLEERASARVGATVQAVISPDACLAADVDRPEQLAGFSGQAA